MQKNVLALLALSIMFLSSNVMAQQGKNGVAAVVNGEKITVEELREAYNMNPEIKNKISFENFYPKALEVYINGALLYQAAEKANVTNSPEYKKQMEIAGQELARKIYLENRVKKEVSEKDIEKEYKNYKNNFKPQKEIKASHILVTDEKTAKDIIAQLNKGANFNDLAKKYSIDKQAELGYFAKGIMVEEFWNAADKMKKGQISQTPVKTQFGYHIIKVEDVRDSKPLPLKKVEPQIKAKLTSNVIRKVFDEVSKPAKVEAYGLDGKSLASAPAAK